MRTILGIIILLLIVGIWYPVIPFPVKQGYHGVGGEFCGIVYQPSCDQVGLRFVTLREVQDIIKNNDY